MMKILFAFTMLLAIAACTNTGVPRQSRDSLAQGAEEKTVEETKETNYFPVIDRYLADSIGSKYAKGELDFGDKFDAFKTINSDILWFFVPLVALSFWLRRVNRWAYLASFFLDRCQKATISNCSRNRQNEESK